MGAGLVLDYPLISSATGLASHVGFMASPLAPMRCESGRGGTVESVAAGPALVCASVSGSPAAAGAHWADAIIDRSAGAIARLCADLRLCLGLT